MGCLTSPALPCGWTPRHHLSFLDVIRAVSCWAPPLLSWPGRSTQGAGTWGSPQPLDATPARAARCLPAPQVPAPTSSGRRGFAPPSEPERLGAPCATATGYTLPAHPSGSPRPGLGAVGGTAAPGALPGRLRPVLLAQDGPH